MTTAQNVDPARFKSSTGSSQGRWLGNRCWYSVGDPGLVAIAVPLTTAIAIGLLFGWLFILGGIIQMSYAFLTRASGAFIWKFVLGVFYLLGGISVLFAPGIAALTLSLILAISIVVQSLIQVVTALQIRPEQGWGWVLFSGVTGLILGGLIWGTGTSGCRLVAGRLVRLESVVRWHWTGHGLSADSRKTETARSFGSPRSSLVRRARLPNGETLVNKREKPQAARQSTDTTLFYRETSHENTDSLEV